MVDFLFENIYVNFAIIILAIFFDSLNYCVYASGKTSFSLFPY